VLGAASAVLPAAVVLLLPFRFLCPFFLLLLEAGPVRYREASFPISAHAHSEEAKGGDVAWSGLCTRRIACPSSPLWDVPWAADWTEGVGAAEDDMVRMQLAVLSRVSWLLRTRVRPEMVAPG
jgi:hypothetical protein